MKKRKEILSENDRNATKQLRKLWCDYLAKNPETTQLTASHDLDISQGMLSQYLNNKNPINHQILEKFCEFFNCNPWDIRAEYRDEELIFELTELKQKMEQVCIMLAEINHEETNKILSFINNDVENKIYAC